MITTRPIEESWDRIKMWLAEHAPASHLTLNPPATPEQIGDTFTRLSVPPPHDLVNLLLQHDGASEFGPNRENWPGAHFLPWHKRLLSFAEIGRYHRRLTGILERLDDDRYESALGNWWHPQWIPFAADGMGAVLAIDQRPGLRRGAIGEVERVEGWHREAWPSLAAMMAEIADALEDESTHQHPTVKDGQLTWH